VFRIKRNIKDLQRLRKILSVLFSQGFGYYITKARLKSHLPLSDRLKKIKPLPDEKKQAIMLRETFTKLGPTFIKLGQLMSLRPDLIPKEFATEFEKLQDKVPPFPYRKVEAIIEQELGKPINKLFKSFDKKPLASASIAQVHKGKLKNGKDIVVKVQRPDIQETIDADLDIMFLLAQSLEKHFPKARNYRPIQIVKEFAFWTRRELDFKIELQNATRLKDAMKNNKNIGIPNVYKKFSSRKLLTMDFVEGIKLDKIATLKKSKFNKKKIVMNYFTSILEQALIYGMFHADPHPANIFIQKNGTLVYLDYGIVGELTIPDRKKLIRFIRSIPASNPERSLDIILSLAIDTSNADLNNFKRESLPIFRDAYNNPIGETSLGKAFYKVISIGAKNGVIFDPNHVLMAKAIYQAEGLGLKIYPKFSVSEGLQQFSAEYLQHEFSPTNIVNQISESITKQKDILLSFPNHISKIIERLEQKPHQHCEKEHIQEIEEHLIQTNSSSHTLFLISILFVASLSFFYLEGKREIMGVGISNIFFVLAIFFLIHFMIAKIKSYRRDKL
jgi:ubiquinone biosynthesis protein